MITAIWHYVVVVCCSWEVKKNVRVVGRRKSECAAALMLSYLPFLALPACVLISHCAPHSSATPQSTDNDDYDEVLVLIGLSFIQWEWRRRCGGGHHLFRGRFKLVAQLIPHFDNEKWMHKPRNGWQKLAACLAHLSQNSSWSSFTAAHYRWRKGDFPVWPGGAVVAAKTEETMRNCIALLCIVRDLHPPPRTYGRSVL